MLSKASDRKNLMGMVKRANWMAGMALLGAVALVGCNSPDVPPAQPTAPTIPDEPMALTSTAGVPLTAAATPVDIKTVASSKRFEYRADPFALKSSERQYETEQEGLRVFGELGGFTVQFTPKEEEAVQQDFPEPQPYRRLAGIVVGDSILALIDMGDGKGLQIIRPGQTIEGSEWRVASIDSEKAVLVRSGTRTPRRIIVKLEAPAFGTTPSGGGAGFPGAGFPGGRPSGGGPTGPGFGPGGGSFDGAD